MEIDRIRGIKAMPEAERPTERLYSQGPGALNAAELMAVIIRCGTKGESALEAGMRILSENGGLFCLASMSARELSRAAKLGRTRAAQLKAAVELGMRVAGDGVRERTGIITAKDAGAILMPAMRHLKCEEFWALLLDTRHRVIDTVPVSRGTLNSSLVHPRELFREAMLRNSAAVIAAHNHPSGDPAASDEDLAITRRLAEAGRIIGIELLDHLIIGANSYTSLRDSCILGSVG